MPGSVVAVEAGWGCFSNPVGTTALIKCSDDWFRGCMCDSWEDTGILHRVGSWRGVLAAGFVIYEAISALS